MLTNKRLFAVLGLVIALALVVTGCGATGAPVEEGTTEPTDEVAAPTEEMTEAAPEPTEAMTEEAGGDLGTPDNPIVFAFVPSGDMDAIIASADAISEVLSQATGLTIEAFVPTTNVGAIEALCSGEAHVAALNTFSYVLASERDCAEAVLVSTRFGSPTYAGQLITRPDTGIEGWGDLAGHTFCRDDELSTSSWIIPAITMAANGVNPDTDLGEPVDAGSHDGVVRAVYDGDCDAGATYVDAREAVQDEAEYADVMDKVIKVAETDPIPNDTIAFHPDVPAELRDTLSASLLAMLEDEASAALLEALYSWTGLVEVDDSFYDTFRQVLEESGLSIESFNE